MYRRVEVPSPDPQAPLFPGEGRTRVVGSGQTEDPAGLVPVVTCRVSLGEAEVWQVSLAVTMPKKLSHLARRGLLADVGGRLEGPGQATLQWEVEVWTLLTNAGVWPEAIWREQPALCLGSRLPGFGSPLPAKDSMTLGKLLDLQNSPLCPDHRRGTLRGHRGGTWQCLAPGPEPPDIVPVTPAQMCLPFRPRGPGWQRRVPDCLCSRVGVWVP